MTETGDKAGEAMRAVKRQTKDQKEICKILGTIPHLINLVNLLLKPRQRHFGAFVQTLWILVLMWPIHSRNVGVFYLEIAYYFCQHFMQQSTQELSSRQEIP